MKFPIQGRSGQISAVLFLILLGTGCTATPTSEPTAAPTVPPTTSPSVADLTAKEVNVTVLGDANPESALQKDETVDIQVADQITLDQGGRGELSFQERMVLELFRDTQIKISDAILDAGETGFVRIDQIYGHTRLRLNEGTASRLTLETDFAELTSQEEGTEFLVCHDPEALTCMVTIDGTVEVTARGETVTVKGGEATYIFPGEAPQPPICVRVDEVEEWLNQKRSTEQVGPLGELVAGWPPEACPSTALASPEGMANIPAGTYEVGADLADGFHVASQERTVVQFWIDVRQVTNEQYAQYLDQSGQPPPLTWPGQANHPVKGVTWEQAAAYCTWANKRLPTELEWEIAARGPGADPPLYPWGDDPLADGQVNDLPRSETYEAGSVPFNQSPFGIFDMSGNVWEWVGEPYDLVPAGEYILRGGRHGFLKDSAYRQTAAPDDPRFTPLAGFRCAADQVEGA